MKSDQEIRLISLIAIKWLRECGILGFHRLHVGGLQATYACTADLEQMAAVMFPPSFVWMLMIRNLNEPEQPGFCSYVSATILWAAESIEGTVFEYVNLQLVLCPCWYARDGCHDDSSCSCFKWMFMISILLSSPFSYLLDVTVFVGRNLGKTSSSHSCEWCDNTAFSICD